jgi:hypothetical protein
MTNAHFDRGGVTRYAVDSRIINAHFVLFDRPTRHVFPQEAGA